MKSNREEVEDAVLLLSAVERAKQARREVSGWARVLAESEEKIKAYVEINGSVSVNGVQAQFKPGRKSTDHEAAATKYGAADEHVAPYRTVKVTVKWAEVTKALGLSAKDLEPFTTDGPDSFSIEYEDSV